MALRINSYTVSEVLSQVRKLAEEFQQLEVEAYALYKARQLAEEFQQFGIDAPVAYTFLKRVVEKEQQSFNSKKNVMTPQEYSNKNHELNCAKIIMNLFALG